MKGGKISVIFLSLIFMGSALLQTAVVNQDVSILGLPKATKSAPGAPRNLVNASLPNAIILVWDPPEGVSCCCCSQAHITYRVYRDGEFIATTHKRMYVDHVAGSHTYYVTAVNESGESPPSNEITTEYSKFMFLGPFGAGKFPLNYHNGSFWTNNGWIYLDGADNFTIYVYDYDNGNALVLQENATRGWHEIDTSGLDGNQHNYTICVYAVDYINYQSPKVCRKVTYDTVAPPKPAWYSPTNGISGRNDIQLAAEVPSDFEKCWFVIYDNETDKNTTYFDDDGTNDCIVTKYMSDCQNPNNYCYHPYYYIEDWAGNIGVYTDVPFGVDGNGPNVTIDSIDHDPTTDETTVKFHVEGGTATKLAYAYIYLPMTGWDDENNRPYGVSTDQTPWYYITSDMFNVTYPIPPGKEITIKLNDLPESVYFKNGTRFDPRIVIIAFNDNNHIGIAGISQPLPVDSWWRKIEIKTVQSGNIRVDIIYNDDDDNFHDVVPLMKSDPMKVHAYYNYTSSSYLMEIRVKNAEVIKNYYTGKKYTYDGEWGFLPSVGLGLHYWTLSSCNKYLDTIYPYYTPVTREKNRLTFEFTPSSTTGEIEVMLTHNSSTLLLTKKFSITPPPTNLSYSLSGTNVTLTWDPPPMMNNYVEKYVIYRAENVVNTNLRGGISTGDEKYKYVMMGEVSPQTTSFTDRNLSYGTVYTYKIAAVYNDKSSFSDGVAVTPIPDWIYLTPVEYHDVKGVSHTIYQISLTNYTTQLDYMVFYSPLLAQAYRVETDRDLAAEFELNSIIATLYWVTKIHPDAFIINLDYYMGYANSPQTLRNAVYSLPVMKPEGYAHSNTLVYLLDSPNVEKFDIWKEYSRYTKYLVNYYNPRYVLILGSEEEFPEYPVFDPIFGIYFSDDYYVSYDSIIMHYYPVGRLAFTSNLIPFSSDVIPIAARISTYVSSGASYFRELYDATQFQRNALISGMSYLTGGIFYPVSKNLIEMSLLLENKYGYNTTLMIGDEHSNEPVRFNLTNYSIFYVGWHGNTNCIGSLTTAYGLDGLHPMLITGFSCLISNQPFAPNLNSYGATLVGNTADGWAINLGVSQWELSTRMAYIFTSLAADNISFGDALADAKSIMYNDWPYVSREFRLYGDPSVKITGLTSLKIDTISKAGYSILTDNFTAKFYIRYGVNNGTINATIQDQNLPSGVVANISYRVNARGEAYPYLNIHFTANASSLPKYLVSKNNETVIMMYDNLNATNLLGIESRGNLIVPITNSTYIPERNITVLRMGDLEHVTISIPLTYISQDDYIKGFENVTVAVNFSVEQKDRPFIMDVPSYLSLINGSEYIMPLSILFEKNATNATLILNASQNIMFDISDEYKNSETVYLGNFTEGEEYSVNLKIKTSQDGLNFINISLVTNDSRENRTIKVISLPARTVFVSELHAPEYVNHSANFTLYVDVTNSQSSVATGIQLVILVDDSVVNITYINELSAGETVRIFKNLTIEEIGMHTISAYTNYRVISSTNDLIRTRIIVKASKPPTPHPNIGYGDGYVNISWEQASNITMVYLYRGINGGNMSIYAILDSNTTYFNDTNVINGFTYSYAVRFVNYNTMGELSNMVSGTPKGAPTPPRNLTAEYNDTYVLLKWDLPLSDGGYSIVQYNIYRANESGNFVLIATVDSNTYTYKDTNITAGMNYTYYVTAVNSFGESDESNQAKVSTPPVIPEFPYDVLIIVTLATMLSTASIYVLRRRKRMNK